ncbi:MAG: hypothetical protein D3914_01070 [Candidatus Electrothrix sp. LOE2]|nr:hypothetical protein [Candidatus Electrothrix sp. LOE2]
MIDFIHIGLPKTGSTYLQQVIFKQHPEINCLGSGYSINIDQEFILLIRKIVNGHSFLHESREIYNRLATLLNNNKRCQNKTLNGLSAEGLSQTIYDAKMITHVACMLHHIAPSAKIVIFVRNQFDMIDSFYRQYIVEGGTKKINEFLFSPIQWFSLDYLNCNIDPLDVHGINRFKYYGIVRTYIDLFGKNNVHICMQEKLKSEREKTLRDLYDFLEINYFNIEHKENVNSKKSFYQYELLRFINKFFCSDAHRESNYLMMKAIRYLSYFINFSQFLSYDYLGKNTLYDYMII